MPSFTRASKRLGLSIRSSLIRASWAISQHWSCLPLLVSDLWRAECRTSGSMHSLLKSSTSKEMSLIQITADILLTKVAIMRVPKHLWQVLMPDKPSKSKLKALAASTYLSWVTWEMWYSIAYSSSAVSAVVAATQTKEGQHRVEREKDSLRNIKSRKKGCYKKLIYKSGLKWVGLWSWCLQCRLSQGNREVRDISRGMLSVNKMLIES